MIARIALACALASCGQPRREAAPTPTPAPTPAPASGSSHRKLGTQPLEATVPDDARVDDWLMLGPDDAGAHGACLSFHGASSAGWESSAGSTSLVNVPCDGINLIQDTTQGRRPEDAHVRVTSMAEDLASLHGLHITRSDEIADGWIIEYSGQDGYTIVVHRTIAGTPWSCGLHTQTHAEIAEAERACMSLRASP